MPSSTAVWHPRVRVGSKPSAFATLISQLPHSSLQQNLPRTGTSSLTNILDAREEHFAFGDGEGRAFDLDVNEIGGAQEKRVLLGVWPAVRLHQTWNASPQPQLPVEFGLLSRKPEPMMSST